MIETTDRPCAYCEASADEPCSTPTGLQMDRVHVNRQGEMWMAEPTGPLLSDALNRHCTDIPKFMKENGL